MACIVGGRITSKLRLDVKTDVRHGQENATRANQTMITARW